MQNFHKRISDRTGRRLSLAAAWWKAWLLLRRVQSLLRSWGSLGFPGLAVLAPLASCVLELRADAELAPGNIVNSPFRQFCLKEKTEKEEKGGNRDPAHPAQRQDSEEREGRVMKG